MKGWTRLLPALAVGAVLLAAVTGSASGQGGGPGKLEVFTITLDPAQAAQLARAGVDVVAARQGREKVEIDAVLDARQRAQLARRFDVKVKRNRDGKTATELAAEQAAAGHPVFRSWDEPGGIRDELYEIARSNPQLVKLEVLGHTYQGREIIALKVSLGARGADGRRPAVLYSSLQHAREWISVEVNRRLLHYFVDNFRENKDVRKLLQDTELWFVPVANPDGYQYTFDHERLWRKNLRDNDGNGEITVGDGVDPNRNYPEHWRYDEEGSSSIPSSDTYRGPAPNSEPETQALKGLLDRIKFKFQVNYHSFGEWLLYPEGWQIGTPTADDPIYFALSGNLDQPAIEGFQPGLSSDVLYVTNGETTDYAHIDTGALAWTPELGEGIAGSGFVFPDDENLIQKEFERNLPFALDVARSAPDPDDPVSHQGRTTKPFYLKSDDTYKTGLPEANYTFDVSYGDPQEVRVVAKRSLGAVTVNYQINGGAVHSGPTAEWNGGQRYGGRSDVYYHVMRGTVTGTQPGDTVKVWFTGGQATSDSFTYRAVTESSNRVLVVSAEDYTGASPVYASSAGPLYLSYYTNALTANGIGFDVYDVDASGREAPDALGVLSHYDAVVWYTGNDIVTREPGWGAGNASRLAMDELLEVRTFLNEGGRVLYTGKYAGHQYAPGHGTQLYDPTAANGQCADPAVQPRCLPLGGSGDGTNDVLQYWLGAYIVNENAGTAEDGSHFDVLGTDTPPFTSLEWGFNGPDSAQNQDHSASFITTSGILPPSIFPQFESFASAQYDRPGGPFAPHTGQYFAYSQIADVSYKRLTRTISVPAAGGTLSFWTSYDTEPEWDHLVVEAHTVGQEDWTTLPDLNGHTSQSTGQSCPEGWRELHPFLDHYQTLNDGPTPTCSPTGTTGAWNAASGNSGGWQQWSVDLSAYAGKQVEVSIAYVSDWASQGLGVFVDDITLPTGETTSFEADLGGWAVTGPPPGSAPNANNFIRTTAEGFPEGAAINTPRSIYFGFGFEGITGSATRNEIMRRATGYLLP